MSKPRDWSEWKRHISGKDREENRWKRKPSHSTSRNQDHTHTAYFLQPELDEEEETHDRKTWLWIIILLSVLIVRRTYTDFTKSHKSSSAVEQSFSR